MTGVHRHRAVAVLLLLASGLLVPLPVEPGAQARTTPASPSAARFGGRPADVGLTNGQRATLLRIAQQTWQFFLRDVDKSTDLPRNHLDAHGPSTEGAFTSPTEIGFYLMSLAAALDLHVVDPQEATAMASQELRALGRLQTYRGFLLRWYSTATGQPLSGPRGATLVSGGFVSTVDNAWYATGLIVAKHAFPALSQGFEKLLSAMDFSLLFDARRNQLYNGYTVGRGPTPSTYKLLFGGTRIADYAAIGSGQVPGTLWWGLERAPMSQSLQRHVPVGSDVAYSDPQTGAVYRVFEGHYRYRGIDYVPTFAGSMFQALAPSLVIPEARWGPASFGRNDVNTVLAQAVYAKKALHYPVWGLAPATTPNRVNGYAQYGAPGLAVRRGHIPDDAVTPYASFLALLVAPQPAFANIANLLRRYKIDSPEGLYDSVNPSTGQVAQRYMAVSQGVILTAIDDALDNDQIQVDFAADPFASALQPYVSAERFSLGT